MMSTSGGVALQVFNLSVKANTIKQGKDPIEVFYSKLVALWKDIDLRMPTREYHNL